MEKWENWFNNDSMFTLKRPITLEQAKKGFHSGDCEKDVIELKKELNFTVPEQPARQYLINCGFERDEVNKMDLPTLENYILWSFCACIAEENDGDFWELLALID